VDHEQLVVRLRRLILTDVAISLVAALFCLVINVTVVRSPWLTLRKSSSIQTLSKFPAAYSAHTSAAYACHLGSRIQ